MTQFDYEMLWHDNRLTFSQLRGWDAIDKETQAKIWIPELVYTNTREIYLSLTNDLLKGPIIQKRASRATSVRKGSPSST